LAMCAAVFVATKMPAPRVAKPEPYFKGIRNLVADARWYGFLLGVFLVGLSFSAISNYFILFVKSLGGGESLFGLSVAFASVSELPVFFFSSYMLRRWSANRMLMMAVAVMAVRCLLVSLMVDPRLALVVQLMHGMSFSLMWAAGVSYASEIAPPGMGATAQALFSTTQFGLGNGVGALLGSQVYADSGPVTLYKLAALSSLAGFILLVLVARRMKYRAVPTV